MSKPFASPRHRAIMTTGRPQGGRLIASQIFLALVGDEVARAWRYDRMLGIALAKLDPMDRPGRDAAALTAAEVELTVLEFLSGHLRAPDRIALMGPGEFGILLPEASPRHARIAAQRLCDQVAAAVFRVRGQDFAATLSIGAATLSHRVRTAEQLLLAARQEWRRAQAGGGNRVAALAPARLQTGQARSAEMH